MGVTRREFLKQGAAAGLVAATPSRGALEAPAVRRSTAAEPVVIASGNGNIFKNGGTVTGVEKAFTLMTGGADVLDALIAGVNIVELDPEDDSVGYGGLPNADGVVQLDSCCMHGPRKRAGGVAALEGVRTPSLVAQAVMEQTDHHLLVGKGAQEFARQHGLQDRGRPQHRELAPALARVEAPRPIPRTISTRRKRAEAGRRVRRCEMVREG